MSLLLITVTVVCYVIGYQQNKSFYKTFYIQFGVKFKNYVIQNMAPTTWPPMEHSRGYDRYSEKISKTPNGSTHFFRILK